MLPSEQKQDHVPFYLYGICNILLAININYFLACYIDSFNINEFKRTLYNVCKFWTVDTVAWCKEDHMESNLHP